MSDMDMTTMGDAGKAMPVPRGQYSDTETYDYLDFVYSGDASYIAKKLTTGNPPAENNEYWQLFARGGTLTENSDVSNTTVTFETAETRSNIFSRESLKTIAGKVSKMYSDLKAVAFSGKYTDLPDRLTVTNNDLANVPGTAWDAVRGAQIRKDLDKLNSDLQSKIIIKNYSFTDISFDAGVLGSRALQMTQTIEGIDGYSILSAVVIRISDSSLVIPVVLFSYYANNVHLNLYRATERAVSGLIIEVRAVLAKL